MHLCCAMYFQHYSCALGTWVLGYLQRGAHGSVFHMWFGARCGAEAPREWRAGVWKLSHLCGQTTICSILSKLAALRNVDIQWSVVFHQFVLWPCSSAMFLNAAPFLCVKTNPPVPYVWPSNQFHTIIVSWNVLQPTPLHCAVSSNSKLEILRFFFLSENEWIEMYVLEYFLADPH